MGPYLTYIKLGAALVVVLAVVSLTLTINGWRNDSRALKQTELQLQIAQAQGKVDAMTIAEWKKVADERQKRADEANAMALKIASEWRERVVYKEPAPAQAGDACPERIYLEWLVAEYQPLYSAW